MLCDLIQLKLQAIALTAAHCARTLIGAAVAGNMILRYSTKLLLPVLVQYAVNAASEERDNDDRALARGEVWKAMDSFYASVKEAESKVTMCRSVIHY